MPEGPEVEVVARQLWRALGNFTVVGGKSFHKKFERRSPKGNVVPPFPVGARLRKLWRHGKWVNFDFDSPGGPILIQANLGMSGRFVLCEGRNLPTGVKKAHVKWTARVLTKDEQPLRIVYVDPRGMGHLRMLDRITAAAARSTSALSLGVDLLRLGPDTMRGTLVSGPDWKRRNLLRARLKVRRPIKQVLMDQSRVAGLGNIYAAEACWYMRVHPDVLACDLSTVHLDRFLRNMPSVLLTSARLGGTSFGDANTYRDSKGREGSNFSRLRVYGRAGQPCHKCKTLVVRKQDAGRSTFYCPKCQEVQK